MTAAFSAASDKTAVSLTVHGGFLNYSGFMLVRIDNACPMR